MWGLTSVAVQVPKANPLSISHSEIVSKVKIQLRRRANGTFWITQTLGKWITFQNICLKRKACQGTRCGISSSVTLEVPKSLLLDWTEIKILQCVDLSTSLIFFFGRTLSSNWRSYTCVCVSYSTNVFLDFGVLEDEWCVHCNTLL